MRVKVGTVLEAEVLKKAKTFSAARDVPLNQLIEEALELYMKQQQGDTLLSLEEVLGSDPSSHSKEGSGRGEGDYRG